MGRQAALIAMVLLGTAVSVFAGGNDIELGSASGVRLLGDDDYYLKLGAGVFDIARIGGDDANAGTRFGAQAELFVGKKLLWIAPVAGVLANHDGGVYGYGGGRLDFAWGPWRAGPVLGLGAYEEGNGKDLGGVFQFHVGGAVDYQLEGGSRIGITFAHLSNREIHDENPGTEFLLLHWMLPLRFSGENGR